MCKHPNIVSLIDYIENEESLYLVIDYYEGGDLYDYMLQRGFAVGEERVKEIAFQVSNAIQYLQSYGIMHRDIKLENIMMSNKSNTAVTKLVDFGLAKILGPDCLT